MGLVCCRSHSLFLVEISRAEQGKWGWGWGSTFRRAEEANCTSQRTVINKGHSNPLPRQQ